MRRAIAIAAILLLPSLARAETEFTLNVVGGNESLTQRLERASAARGAIVGEEDATSEDILAAAQADYARYLGALYDEGYYSVAISIRIDGREAAGIPVLDAPERIDQVAVLVEPGPRFRFGQAEIRPLARGTVLPEQFATGRIARSGAIQNAAQTAADGWRDLGHAKADIGQEDITAIHPERRLDVALSIVPGPRLTFGELQVRGNRRMRTERVVEIAGLPTGDVYSPQQLQRAATRLRRSGVFGAVTLREAEDPNADGSLDITALVSEQPPRRITLFAEYSTVEGLSLGAEWLHRNLLGGGERLTLSAEVLGLAGETGGIDTILGARLSRPATFLTDMDAYLEFQVERSEEPDFTLTEASLEAGVRYFYSEDLRFDAGVSVRFGEVDFALGTLEYEIVGLPLEVEWDTRDEPLDAKEGFYLAALAEPFVGFGLADSGALLTADGRTYFGFGEDDRFVLALRSQIGALLGAEAFAVPSDFLFFSGGGGTVRGQPYQSLGVPLGGGQIGGRSFLALSTELRAQLRGNLGAVGFFDAGFVGPDSLPSDDGNWHYGAGIGVRYATPLGPIRVDLAAPVGDTTGEGHVVLYIGVGQAF